MIDKDRKPITDVLKPKSDKYSPREIRYPDLISQFTSNMRHVKIKEYRLTKQVVLWDHIIIT